MQMSQGFGGSGGEASNQAVNRTIAYSWETYWLLSVR